MPSFSEEDKEKARRGVAEYARLIAECKNKKKRYEHDFEILYNQEAMLAYAISVCEANVDSFSCIDGSIANIEEIASTDRVPGFEILFDFTNLHSGSDIVKGMVDNNAKCMENLTEVCKNIDSLEKKIGKEIESIDRNINMYQDNIDLLKSVYGI